MSQFFPPNVSGRLFAQALHAAYLQGIQLYDPSRALRDDPDAYDAVLAHGVIKQCFDRRTTLAAGLSWAVEPSGDRQVDKDAAAIDEKILRNVRQFRAARKHLAGAVVRGTSFARVEWQARWLALGDGVYREWLVPMRIKPIDRRLFRAVPIVSRVATPRDVAATIRVEWERFDEARGRWIKVDEADKPNYIRHAFDDDPERLGHGRGLIDAVKFLWWFRAALWEELLNGAEFWSRGFIEVLVDNMRDGSKINQDLVTNYVNQVELHRSRHVFVHDAKDETRVTTGGGEGSQICGEAIKAIDAEIRTLINHSNVNTSASDGGSYALADTQQDSEQMGTVLPDREDLCETLTIALVERGRDLNFGNFVELGLAAAAPGRFSVTNQSLDDPEKTQRVLSAAIKDGAKVSERYYHDRLSIPMPAPGEPLMVVQQQPASPFLGLPAFPSPPMPPKE